MVESLLLLYDTTAMATTLTVRHVRGEHVEPHSGLAQAYHILYYGFIVIPIIMGLDKFFGFLVNWDMYIAPQLANILPVSTHTAVQIAGVIEIAAGLLVAFMPVWGAYMIGTWLGVMVINFLVGGIYYDLALKDFGLMLAAFALGRDANDIEEQDADARI